MLGLKKLILIDSLLKFDWLIFIHFYLLFVYFVLIVYWLFIIVYIVYIDFLLIFNLLSGQKLVLVLLWDENY